MGPGGTPAGTERALLGSVAVAVDHEFRKVLVMAQPGYRAADWDTALAEVKFRCGYVPAFGRPEWFPIEGLWVWEGDLNISDLRF